MDSSEHEQLRPFLGKGIPGDFEALASALNASEASSRKAPKKRAKRKAKGVWQVWELSPRLTHAAEVKESRKRWLLGVFLKN